MITVPVSAGTYQAVVASMQPGGGITFQSASEALASSAGGGNAIQLIGMPLQLANGQIIAKVDTSAAAAAAAAAAAEQQAEASRQSSIQNLVTKVMGEQSIHNNEVKHPATLTITPVRSGGGGSGPAGTSGGGQVIHMVDHSRNSNAAAASNATRLRSSRDQHQPEQPDTTESLD